MDNLVISLTALALGGAIGFLFGVLQTAALARNTKKRDNGNLHNGWAVMPGSMGRIAALLIILAAVQIFCPFLFEGNIQWLVSAGILLGYGWSFLVKLRRRSEERA